MINKDIIGYILLCVGIVFTIMIVRECNDTLKREKRSCIRFFNVSYKGIVIREIGGVNLGYRLDAKNARKRIFYPRCQSLIRGLIEIGDSLYKPRRSFDLYIFKNANPDSVIFIKCDFDCSIYKNSEVKNNILP